MLVNTKMYVHICTYKHTCHFLVCFVPYLGSNRSDHGDRGIYGIGATSPSYLSSKCDLRIQAGTYAGYPFTCMGNISGKLGVIREINVSVESGEQDCHV